MNRLTLSLAIFLFALGGCSIGAYDLAALPEQGGADGYCHKRLEPIGPTDPARIAQSGTGDYIDYYGPCDGPSRSEQIRKQKRFERFRFGRDYMDEG